ncbi:DUF309 domain-containing protein [Gorillibacterium massiliense]|uniref:DUF309 domain-containing protein n=1 Tax=Gorillibacterium massiliense TaxID=1280390 RepID=UPI0004B820B3|nr:DUF309 domain-containing protein [Gorillibacterium massiliense]
MESRREYPQEYLDYLVTFHGERDYFECHEIMEDYWKKTAGTAETKRWLALIQVAVSAYHERRGNRIGARNMAEKAISNGEGEKWDELGLDGEVLIGQIKEQLRRLGESGGTEQYEEPNLPISDLQLLDACRNLAEQRGFMWQNTDGTVHDDIVHKHLRRDRATVVMERERSLAAKRKRRAAPPNSDARE